MQSQNVKNMVRAALFCALTFLGTLISFPAPAGGNVNLGDAFLLIGAFAQPIPWAIFSAAIGASLADFTTGYLLYLPATLFIKTGMVLLAVLCKKGLFKLRCKKLFAQIFSAVFAELWMVLGYYLYESVLLGSFVSPLLNLPLNLLQGAFAVILFGIVEFAVQKKKK